MGFQVTQLTVREWPSSLRMGELSFLLQTYTMLSAGSDTDRDISNKQVILPQCKHTLYTVETEAHPTILSIVLSVRA